MESTMIQADKEIITALKKIAEQDSISVESVAKNALVQYLTNFQKESKSFSFIGIGRSGKSDNSTQTEKILADEIDRKKGWSIS